MSVQLGAQRSPEIDTQTEPGQCIERGEGGLGWQRCHGMATCGCHTAKRGEKEKQEKKQNIKKFQSEKKRGRTWQRNEYRKRGSLWKNV